MLAKLVSESFCLLVTHTALLGLYVSYYHFAYIANYHWVNPMAIKWQSKLSVFHLGSIPIKQFWLLNGPKGHKVALMAKFWPFLALMWS